MLKMVKIYFVALFAISAVVHTESARILCVYPTPSISHHMVFRVLTEGLAKRGHELVVVTTDPVNYKEPEFRNVTEIDVHDISYEIWTKNFNFVSLRGAKNDNRAMAPMYFEVMLDVMDHQLKTKAVKNLIEDKTQKFDLLIVELLVPTMYAFADRFKVPIIAFSSFSATLQNYDSMGNPSHPLLYPDMFTSFVGELSFFQRMRLVFQDLDFRWMYYMHFLPRFEELAKKHFGEDSVPVGVLEKKTDMMFLNIHPMIKGVRPAVPGLVYIGSLHIRPKKPLPKELQAYMDSSPKDVVYFSLGTNVKSVTLPEDKRKMLMEAFSELPYRFLWKWENDSLPGKPDNLRISKWIPQQDLLAHPKLKAFITQGGQQSMDEGIHNEVPMIGIPFLGDQDHNVKSMVHQGIAVMLDFKTLSKESIKEAITEIITNKKYKNNVSRVAKILADAPMTPLDRAVWWVEYVLRHGGARHLRAPLPDFPLHQYFFLDIIAFFLAILIVGLVVLCKVYGLVKKLACGVCCGEKKKKMEHSNGKPAMKKTN